MSIFKLVSCLALVATSTSVCCHAQQQPLVEPYLMSGKLTEGRAALEKHLTSNPKDDQARFGLGVLRFVQAVEHLGQSWYEFGIDDNIRQLPFVRLPVPENPNPKQVTYKDARAVLQKMIGYLDESDKSLAKIKATDVKLPLHLFQLHIDFDKNGKLSPTEDLTKIYAQYLGNEFVQGHAKLNDTVVVFDYGDAQWMRGYTHLIRSMCETILAYDEEPVWDVIAYHVFQKPVFKFKFMEEEFLDREDRDQFMWSNRNSILDAIAGIHNLNFKLVEPERLKRAHHHLKQTVVQSRKMWKSVMAETDDDREWIPNPRQKSMVSATRISKEMVSTWDEFLAEVDAILDGKKLLPFWRGTDKTRGVNLHEVFHKPRDLDVILWVHGSGAVPFLENGEVTEQGTWIRFQRTYGNNFYSFAAWFN